MKKQACSEIPIAQLVAYADAELSPRESECIEEHLKQCPDCRELIIAMQRSMDLTKAMWRKDEQRWQAVVAQTVKKQAGLPKHYRITIAAAVLFLLALGSIGLFEWQGRKPYSTTKQLSPTELELNIERAALGTQMLAVADLLAQQPGGTGYAVERYEYVVHHFKDERDAAKARLRILLKRRASP